MKPYYYVMSVNLTSYSYSYMYRNSSNINDTAYSLIF